MKQAPAHVPTLTEARLAADRRAAATARPAARGARRSPLLRSGGSAAPSDQLDLFGDQTEGEVDR